MSNTPIGNEEAMAEIRKLKETKEKADEVNLGDKANSIVTVDFEADSGERYQGKFEFKRPNVMESMKIGGRKTQILQQSGVIDRDLADDGVLMMAEIMAVLEVVVVKCPEWFLEKESIKDSDVLFHVYGKYTAWNYTFRLNGARVEKGDSKPSA